MFMTPSALKKIIISRRRNTVLGLLLSQEIHFIWFRPTFSVSFITIVRFGISYKNIKKSVWSSKCQLKKYIEDLRVPKKKDSKKLLWNFCQLIVFFIFKIFYWWKGLATKLQHIPGANIFSNKMTEYKNQLQMHFEHNFRTNSTSHLFYSFFKMHHMLSWPFISSSLNNIHP